MSEVVDGQTATANEPRARESLLSLEYPGRGTFDDPKQEWRRLFSELFGTFLLVLVGAGGAVVNASSHGAISRSTAVAAPGLMVMAIILFMGAVSGHTSIQPSRSVSHCAETFPGVECRATSSFSSLARRSPASFCGPFSARLASSVRRNRARASAIGRRCSSSWSSRSGC